MKSQATTLYPFVPSGPNFTATIDFFAELGFAKLWQNGGLAGLRFGGAYFILMRCASFRIRQPKYAIAGENKGAAQAIKTAFILFRNARCSA